MNEEKIKITNPDNLPVIEETSLHRIVVKVKTWQDLFLEDALKSVIAEIPQEEEGFLVFHPQFNLIQNPKTKKFLPISDYLEFKNNTILSVKPFHWKEWNFEEDIEREDWSRGVIKDKEGKIVENFKPDNGNADQQIIGIIPSGANENYISNKGFSYSIYPYLIFLKNILIGKIVNPFPYEEGTKWFSKVYFLQKICFDNVAISNANFDNCLFSSFVKFKKVTFYNGVNFSNSLFEKTVFFLETSFLNGEFFFKNCIFLKSIFCKDIKTDSSFDFTQSCILGKFSITGDFIENPKNNYNFFKFTDIRCSDIFNMNMLLPKNTKANISFQDSTFSQKLYFSLADDSKENYQNLTLNLYHASFGDFVCDDRNLAEVKLLCSETMEERQESIRKKIPFIGEHEYEKLTEKDVIEQAIAERRVFRKILQDLHWGDKADEEYAKIMDLQTGLEGNWFKKLIVKIFFGWWLGWGVRILTWKFWEGGIIWSSLVLLIIYLLLYQIPDWSFTVIESYFVHTRGGFFLVFHKILEISSVSINSNTDKINIFKIVSLIFNETKDWRDLFVVITGFLQINFFVVILARKFMRM